MRVIYIEDTGDIGYTKDKCDAIILDPKCEDFDRQLQIAFYYKFQYPIVKNEQVKKKLKRPCLLLSKDINENNSDSFDIFLNKVKFALKNYNSNNSNICSNYIVLSKETIEFLKYYTLSHKFKTKNGYEQREISGIFNMYPVGNNMIEVSVDKKTVNSGELETTSHTNTIGSFHTHPLDAYIKYNVCIAFPSADDYFTTLHIYASGYGVFHITSTLEGLYVITVKKSFMKEDRNKILKNFTKYKDDIEETYGMDYPICDPKKDHKIFWRKYLKKYIQKINRLKYFKVQFIFWKDTHKPIKIEYDNINNNCLISDNQINIIKRI